MCFDDLNCNIINQIIFVSHHFEFVFTSIVRAEFDVKSAFIYKKYCREDQGSFFYFKKKKFNYLLCFMKPSNAN